MSTERMSMEPGLRVVSVERIDGTEIIVEFSDSTCATYTPEQLARLAPDRLEVDSPAPGLGPESADGTGGV